MMFFKCLKVNLNYIPRLKKIHSGYMHKNIGQHMKYMIIDRVVQCLVRHN
jgi:hypothetical protein